MEKEDCSMSDNRGCSLGAVGLAFVTGGLLGAAAALLLAPQSGRESQKQLRGMRDEPKKAFMSWPTRPARLSTRPWTKDANLSKTSRQS